MKRAFLFLAVLLLAINGYGQISIGDVVTFYNGGHIGFKTKN